MKGSFVLPVEVKHQVSWLQRHKHTWRTHNFTYLISGCIILPIEMGYMLLANFQLLASSNKKIHHVLYFMRTCKCRFSHKATTNPIFIACCVIKF